MKKQILVVVLGCTIAASTMTGCGQKENPSQNSTAESVAEPTLSDDARSSSLPKTESIPEESVHEYKAGSDVKESDARDPMFQMGDTEITLGESLVSDLIDAGAAIEPNGVITDADYSESPGGEHEISLSFEDSTFTVTEKNDTKTASAVKNSTITGVYADQGPLFAIGGIRVGDSIDNLTFTLGDPYTIINGVDIDPDYSDIDAYYYSSRWDDKNVLFLVNSDNDTVISFKENLPTNYITNAETIPSDALYQLIEKRNKDAASPTKSPILIDLPNSEFAVSELSDVKFTSAKVYTLDEIKDAIRFNADISSLSECVPLSYLVVEYEGKLNYSQDEIEHLEFIGEHLESSYDVNGCFYVLNGYLDDKGEICSGISSTTVHELPGVYLSEEKMLEDLILPKDIQGYTLSDYSVSEASI